VASDCEAFLTGQAYSKAIPVFGTRESVFSFQAAQVRNKPILRYP
jgi:hypothetical protein